MNTSLAERLKAVRGKIPQAEFAELVGIHKSSWGRYERGEGEPSASDLLKICSIFDVSPQWILLGTGPMFFGQGATSQERALPSSLSQDEGSRYIKLEKELEEERGERRELAAENRKLWKENAELREKCARLEERQGRSETVLFDENRNIPRSNELHERP